MQTLISWENDSFCSFTPTSQHAGEPQGVNLLTRKHTIMLTAEHKGITTVFFFAHTIYAKPSKFETDFLPDYMLSAI